MRPCQLVAKANSCRCPVMHNTRVTCDSGLSTITFTRVDCTSFDADEGAHTKRGVEVVFQHDDSDGRFPSDVEMIALFYRLVIQQFFLIFLCSCGRVSRRD